MIWVRTPTGSQNLWFTQKLVTLNSMPLNPSLITSRKSEPYSRYVASTHLALFTEKVTGDIAHHQTLKLSSTENKIHQAVINRVDEKVSPVLLKLADIQNVKGTIRLTDDEYSALLEYFLTLIIRNPDLLNSFLSGETSPTPHPDIELLPEKQLKEGYHLLLKTILDGTGEANLKFFLGQTTQPVVLDVNWAATSLPGNQGVIIPLTPRSFLIAEGVNGAFQKNEVTILRDNSQPHASVAKWLISWVPAENNEYTNWVYSSEDETYVENVLRANDDTTERQRYRLAYNTHSFQLKPTRK